MLLHSTHYMAQIKINKEKFVEGKFTVKQKLVESEELVPDGSGNMVPQQKVVIVGIFSTHDYIEELDTIESERYLIQDINVYEETFGSNDYEISYEFVAGSLTVKEDYVPEKVKIVVEADLYQDENKEYFHSINWKLAEQIYDNIVNGEEGMDDDE